MSKKMFAKKKSSAPIVLLLILILAGVFVIYRYRASDSEPQTEQSQTAQAQPQARPVSQLPVAQRQQTPALQSDQPRQPEPTPQQPAVQSQVSQRSAPAEEFPGSSLFEQGRAAWQGENVIQARDLLSQAVAAGLSLQNDNAAREMLNQAAGLWLFSRRVFEDDQYCSRYTVQSGDLLVNVSKRYDIPYALLMRINGIGRPELLQAGQTLKVVQGPFRILVDRDRCLMTVMLDNVIVRSYLVGLGAPGRDTPLGLWRSAEGRKQHNPAWTDPDTGEHYYADDPQNPLGTRWIGLEGIRGETIGRVGFGIHGTINPQEIGRAVSRGCIRLHNRDVEELYDMVTDGVTEVQVY